jgi:hypothetical protein
MGSITSECGMDCCPNLGEKILVVDEIADTGETLTAVTRKLTEKNEEFDVACLYVNTKNLSKVNYPDYYAATTENWIIFPWEVR